MKKDQTTYFGRNPSHASFKEEIRDLAYGNIFVKNKESL